MNKFVNPLYKLVVSACLLRPAVPEKIWIDFNPLPSKLASSNFGGRLVPMIKMMYRNFRLIECTEIKLMNF